MADYIDYNPVSESAVCCHVLVRGGLCENVMGLDLVLDFWKGVSRYLLYFEGAWGGYGAWQLWNPIIHILP